MRYYFHLRKGLEQIIDHEGIELEEYELMKIDIDEIIDEIRSEESHSPETEGWSVEVVDENGRTIASIPLS